MCTLMAPKFIPELRPFLELQTHLSNCLFNISTWMSNKYLKLNMSKNSLLIVPLKPALSRVFSILLIAISFYQMFRSKCLKSSSTLILSHPKSNLSTDLLVIAPNIPRISLCSSPLLLVPWSKPP